MNLSALFLRPSALAFLAGAMLILFVSAVLRRRGGDGGKVSLRDAFGRGFLPLALVGIALLEPTFGVERTAVERKGLEAVFVLDVSQSMLAEDAAPNRLMRAKAEISAVLALMRGERAGLVVFAGDARLSCPLTTDHRSLERIIRDADRLSVARGGTDLGRAIELAATMFSADASVKSIVLLTDGEDHEARGLAAAAKAQADGILVSAAGVGSALGAKLPGDALEQGFRKDKGGQDVLSVLDEAALQRIAAAGGGGYVRIAGGAGGPSALADLFTRTIVSRAGTRIRSDGELVRENRYRWPLLPAIFFVAFELVRRRRFER